MIVINGFRTGVLLPRVSVAVGKVGPAEPLVATEALIDTGADHCIVRADVLAQIGLDPTPRNITANLAGASVSAATAWVSLILRDAKTGATITINPVEVVVIDQMNEAVIVGWQALQHLDLTFARGGEFSLQQ